MCLEEFEYPLSQYVSQNAAAEVDRSFTLSVFPAQMCIIAALNSPALNRYFGFKSYSFNFDSLQLDNLVPSVFYDGLCRPLEPKITD